jgi:excisionase family DNA binding protein
MQIRFQRIVMRFGNEWQGATGMNSEKEILSVKRAAQVLGCSSAHVSNLLNGKVAGVPPIPHVRAGRLRLIRYATLMRWIEEQEEASKGSVNR